MYKILIKLKGKLIGHPIYSSMIPNIGECIVIKTKAMGVLKLRVKDLELDFQTKEVILDCYPI